MVNLKSAIKGLLDWRKNRKPNQIAQQLKKSAQQATKEIKSQAKKTPKAFQKTFGQIEDVAQETGREIKEIPTGVGKTARGIKRFGKRFIQEAQKPKYLKQAASAVIPPVGAAKPEWSPEIPNTVRVAQKGATEGAFMGATPTSKKIQAETPLEKAIQFGSHMYGASKGAPGAIWSTVEPPVETGILKKLGKEASPIAKKVLSNVGPEFASSLAEAPIRRITEGKPMAETTAWGTVGGTAGRAMLTPVIGALGKGDTGKKIWKETGEKIFKTVADKVDDFKPGDEVKLRGKEVDEVLDKAGVSKKVKKVMKEGLPIDLDDAIIQLRQKGEEAQELFVKNIRRGEAPKIKAEMKAKTKPEVKPELKAQKKAQPEMKAETVEREILPETPEVKEKPPEDVRATLWKAFEFGDKDSAKALHEEFSKQYDLPEFDVMEKRVSNLKRTPYYGEIKEIEDQIDKMIGYEPTGAHWKKEYRFRQEYINDIKKEAPENVRRDLDRYLDKLAELRRTRDKMDDFATGIQRADTGISQRIKGEAIKEVKEKARERARASTKRVKELGERVRKEGGEDILKTPREKTYLKQLESVQKAEGIKEMPDVEAAGRTDGRIRAVLRKEEPEGGEKTDIFKEMAGRYQAYKQVVNPREYVKEQGEHATEGKIPGVSKFYTRSTENILESDHPFVKFLLRWGPKNKELRENFVNKTRVTYGLKKMTQAYAMEFLEASKKKLKELGTELDRRVLGEIARGLKSVDDFDMKDEVAQVYKDLSKELHINMGLPVYAELKLEDKWVKEGLLDKADRPFVKPEKFAENMSEYFHTSYRDADKSLLQEIWGGKITQGKVLAELGLPPSWANKKVSLEDWGKKSVEIRYKKRFEGEIPDDVLKQRIKERIEELSEKELKNLGATLKEKAGWEKDPMRAFNLTIQGLTKRFGDAIAMDAIAHNDDFFRDSPAEGFVPIPKGTDKLGPFTNILEKKGKYVKEDVVKAMQNHFTPGGKSWAEDVIDWMRPAVSMWKAGKVLTNAQSWVNNYLSGIILNDMAGAPIHKNPKLYKEAVQEYFKKGGEYKKALAQGLFGGTFARTELSPRETLREGKLKQLMKATSLDEVVEFLGRNYAHIDNVNKYYLYKKAIQDGASDAAAVRYAFKWQLDYSKLPPLGKLFRKAPFGKPFVAFQYLVIPRVYETMMKRPLTLLKYPAMLAGTKAAYATVHGMTMGEVEAQKPTWAEGKTAVVPLYEDRQGRTHWIDFSRAMPFDMAGGVVPVPSVQSQIGGLFRAITPLVTGKDVWGREIQPQGAPKGLASKIKYGIPKAVEGLAPTIFSNIAEGMKGVMGTPYNRFGKTYTPGETLAAFFGAPLYASEKGQIQKKMNYYQMKLGDAKSRLNTVMKSNASRMAKQKAYRTYRRSVQHWYNKMRKLAEQAGGKVGGTRKPRMQAQPEPSPSPSPKMKQQPKEEKGPSKLKFPERQGPTEMKFRELKFPK